MEGIRLPRSPIGSITHDLGDSLLIEDDTLRESRFHVLSLEELADKIKVVLILVDFIESTEEGTV